MKRKWNNCTGLIAAWLIRTKQKQSECSGDVIDEAIPMVDGTPFKPKIFPPKPRRKPVFYRIDDRTFGILNMRDYRERNVRNLFKFGQPEPDELKLTTGHPRAKLRKQRKYAVAQNMAWANSPGDGVTLVMDSAEAIEQAKISRWKIGRYDAVQNLIQYRSRLPDGTFSFSELSQGTLKGKLNYFGCSNPAKVSDNDTAQGGYTYYAMPFRRNNSIAETLGSMRAYLSDDSFITKRNGYLYMKTYEQLNQDNWDLDSGDGLAKIYNFFRSDVGKTVKLRYSGKWRKREFYFPIKTGQIVEITKGNEKRFGFLYDLRFN